MSHWKRLGNVTKGILKEALSNSDDVELTEEELLERLENIRRARPTPSENIPAPQSIAQDEEDEEDEEEPIDSSSTPPTRKPL